MEIWSRGAFLGTHLLNKLFNKSAVDLFRADSVADYDLELRRAQHFVRRKTVAVVI